MIKAPNIEKHLVISTGHITLKDSELLAKEVSAVNPLLIVYGYEYGWTVLVKYDKAIPIRLVTNLTNEGYSKEFINLFYVAQELDCKFIDLDSDGDEYSELPVFDW
jgi:hypothetical protein